MAIPENAVKNNVIIAGVGYSEIGRSTGKSEGYLALESAKNAIEDSGLSRDDIDGIGVWPDRVSSVFEGPSVTYMQRALGLKRTNYWQAFGYGPAQYSSVVGAIYAIASGAASTVICYRAHLRQERRFYVAGTTDSRAAGGEQMFKAPFGVPAGTPRFALWAQRHAHEYGTTDEHRGAVALTAREHAQLNPRAVWHGHPLTMDEYLDSDMIATPLRILDCDMPVDGAVSIIFTRADRAGDIKKKPVYIESLGHATGPTLDFDLWPDVTYMGSRFAAEEMWKRTDLMPSDVDVAQIYDGFSSLSICWLEDLGIVKKGEAGPWFAEGRGKLGGDLPVLTDGGQLGGGRLHGFGKIAESVIQLRGEAGQRQVPNARVGLTCAGGGPVATSILMTAS